MIRLELTQAGQQAIGGGSPLRIEKYLASDSSEIRFAEAYLQGGDTGDYSFIEFPPAYAQAFSAGQTYLKDGLPAKSEYPGAYTAGILDTSLHPSSFDINSLAVIARDEETGSQIILAYGTVFEGTGAYPVAGEDGIGYIFPFAFLCPDMPPASMPNIASDGDSLPWADFAGHRGLSASDTLAVHGLYIDAQNSEIYADGVRISIEVPEEDYDERLSALEARTLDMIHYSQDYPQSYNSEWERRMTGSGTEDDPYLICTPYDFWLMWENPSACYRMESSLDFLPALGMKMDIADGQVQATVYDTSAPLYNDGTGWQAFDFSGKLDGNGFSVRNLCGKGMHAGIFQTLTGTAQNLKIEGSLFCADSISGNYRIAGSLCAKASQAVIRRIKSSATVALVPKFGRYDLSAAGGIIGQAQGGVSVTECAFTGRAVSLDSSVKSAVGGIMGTSQSSIEDTLFCRCTGILEGGYWIGGIIGYYYASRVNAETRGHYFAGTIAAPMQGAYIYSLAYPVSDNRISAFTRCFSLEGSADYMQGTPVSQADLESQGMPGLLNDPLYPACYRYQQDSYPILVFEGIGFPLSEGLASVRGAEESMLDSGIPVTGITDKIGDRSLEAIRDMADSQASQLSRILAYSGTIHPADWRDGHYSADLSSQGFRGSGVYIVPANKAYLDGKISYSVSVTEAGGSIIEFSYGTGSAPQSDIPYRAICIM